MSNLMKSVRIVHSPEEKRYYVQSKSVFGLTWHKENTYEYADVRSTSPHGCHDLAGDAFARATKFSELLLAKTVVWEKTNYMWGP